MKSAAKRWAHNRKTKKSDWKGRGASRFKKGRRKTR